MKRFLDRYFSNDSLPDIYYDLGSAVRSTVCSSRELGFGSQHPHGGLEPPGSPAPEALMPFSDRHGQLHTNMYSDPHTYT